MLFYLMSTVFGASYEELSSKSQGIHTISCISPSKCLNELGLLLPMEMFTANTRFDSEIQIMSNKGTGSAPVAQKASAFFQALSFFAAFDSSSAARRIFWKHEAIKILFSFANNQISANEVITQSEELAKICTQRGEISPAPKDIYGKILSSGTIAKVMADRAQQVSEFQAKAREDLLELATSTRKALFSELLSSHEELMCTRKELYTSAEKLRLTHDTAIKAKQQELATLISKHETANKEREELHEKELQKLQLGHAAAIQAKEEAIAALISKHDTKNKELEARYRQALQDLETKHDRETRKNQVDFQTKLSDQQRTQDVLEKNLRNELADLKNTAHRKELELGNQIEQLTHKHDAENKELEARYRQAQQELETKHEKAKNDLEKDLRNNLADLKNTAHRKELELGNQIEQLIREHALNVTNMNTTHEAALAKLFGEINNLKEKVTEYQEREQASSSKFDYERAVFEKRIADLQERYETQKSTNARKEADFAALSANLEAANKQVAELKDTCVNLRAELRTANDTVALHAQGTGAANAQKEEIQRLNAEIQGRKEELDNLRIKLEEDTKSLLTVQLELRETRGKLGAEVEAQTKNVERLEIDNDKLSAALEKTEANLNNAMLAGATLVQAFKTTRGAAMDDFMKARKMQLVLAGATPDDEKLQAEAEMKFPLPSLPASIVSASQSLLN